MCNIYNTKDYTQATSKKSFTFSIYITHLCGHFYSIIKFVCNKINPGLVVTPKF